MEGHGRDDGVVGAIHFPPLEVEESRIDPLLLRCEDDGSVESKLVKPRDD